MTGLLIVIASFMDWATAFGGAIGKAGTTDGGDGWISVVLGFCIVGIGSLMIAKKGAVGWAVAGLLLAALTVALGCYEVHDVHLHGVDAGPGLSLLIVAGLAGSILAIVGMVVTVPDP